MARVPDELCAVAFPQSNKQVGDPTFLTQNHGIMSPSSHCLSIFHSRSIRISILSAICLISSFCHAATSVNRFAITWTFDTDYTVGQYANGDYWVLENTPGGGVTIIGITPASTLIDGRTMHGSMVNPIAQHWPDNGFDSTLNQYNPDENAARPNGEDLSAENPLVLPAGSSLISSSTHAAAGNRPQLKDASVLTLLAEAPPEGSFRPPYTGTDKSHNWNVADLDYGILQSLAPVTSTPSLTTIERYYERTWIEICTQYRGREWHPSNNQPAYGRDLSARLELGLLSLHLNYTNEEKSNLYTRLVQIGLDIYGAARLGATWSANGGHNHGRKMTMLLAGLALNDSDILSYADAETSYIFQEDQQTWYVTEDDVGREVTSQSGRPREPYTQDHVGLAEWGINHNTDPEFDGSNWGVIYRDVVFTSTMGHGLTAHLTPGAVETWNWPAFFDYLDRVWEVEEGTPSSSNFVNNMWSAYRNFEPLTFKGFSRDADGFIHTGDWLGWLYAQSYPWMYSYSLKRWLYAPDASGAGTGLWVYLPN